MWCDELDRRGFGSLVIGVAAAPLTARAQTAGRTYRLGSLHQSPRSAPHHVAFYEELARLGFVEGQNLIDDPRGYGLRLDELNTHATELVQTNVDVIICAGDACVRAAQRATTIIPILGAADDMFESGLVRSLARPEGNTTGFSNFGTELDGRRQELLIDAVPGIRRMAALAEADRPSQRRLETLQERARGRGVELSVFRAPNPEDIAGAIDAAKAAGAAAVNVLSSAVLYSNRNIIMDRATALRLPAMYRWPEAVEAGGLIGYGPRLVELYRDIWARQLVKLLRGAKPADLPIEQPTRFELVVNLKAAQAIGHSFPSDLLARADKVIE